jgi:hypothetical protein
MDRHKLNLTRCDHCPAKPHAKWVKEDSLELLLCAHASDVFGDKLAADGFTSMAVDAEELVTT